MDPKGRYKMITVDKDPTHGVTSKADLGEVKISKISYAEIDSNGIV